MYTDRIGSGRAGHGSHSGPPNHGRGRSQSHTCQCTRGDDAHIGRCVHCRWRGVPYRNRLTGGCRVVCRVTCCPGDNVGPDCKGSCIVWCDTDADSTLSVALAVPSVTAVSGPVASTAQLPAEKYEMTGGVVSFTWTEMDCVPKLPDRHATSDSVALRPSPVRALSQLKL